MPQENPSYGGTDSKGQPAIVVQGQKADGIGFIGRSSFHAGVDRMPDRTAEKLPGGMKKRLSIACALSNHALFLLWMSRGCPDGGKEIIRNYLREYMASGGLLY